MPKKRVSQSEKEKNEALPNEWVHHTLLCAIFGFAEKSFLNYWRPMINDKDTKKIGRKVYIRGPAFLSIWLASKTKKPASMDGVDLDGAPQELKDQYTTEQIEKLRLQNAKTRGELVPIVDVRAFIAEIGGAMRDASYMVQKAYGEGAQEPIDEATRRFVAKVETMFGSEETSE